jgi:pSer/pThr/pTyr-binding forkhead associated (FHA) protein
MTTDDDYDATASLTLRGTGGLLAGEVRRVRLGETVIVGRSRHCGFSLKKTKAFLLAEDREPLLRDPGFRKVSRQHVRISFVNRGMVEIENLSRNGVRVDGKRIDRLVLLDVAERPHRVDLGGGNEFEMVPGITC